MFYCEGDHWNRLSERLQILKMQLDEVLSTCSSWPFFEQGAWTRWSTEVFSNISHSVILWECLLLICIADLYGKKTWIFVQRSPVMPLKSMENLRTKKEVWSSVSRLRFCGNLHVRFSLVSVHWRSLSKKVLFGLRAESCAKCVFPHWPYLLKRSWCR